VFYDRLRAAALTVAAAGAAGAVGFTLFVGRRNNSRLLLLAFVIWVLSPFAAFVAADAFSRRWPPRWRTALYCVMLAITVVTVAIYGVVALGAPRPKPAAFFLVVPPASCAALALAVSIPPLISRLSSRTIR
jgi:hypothetical protein